MSTPVLLSVVTVSMNRLEHLLATAVRVAAWGEGLNLAWEHVVVDWSSDQPICREQLPAGPQLRLLRVEGESEWSAARAYNFGLTQARGTLLMRLDADVWPATFPVHWIRDLGAAQMLVGGTRGGSEGSWLMRRELFAAVGGFHELMRGYGSDDIDLMARLEALGVRICTLPNGAFGVIHHDTALRVGQSMGGACCAQSLARAWKDALVEANRWVVVAYPWSRNRSRSAYARQTDGSWRAVAASVPQPDGPLAMQLQELRWECFWSSFLGLAPSSLRRLPRAWFGSYSAEGFSVLRWHRWYWASGRRLLLVLRRLLLALSRG
jgi:hypothetical protein